MIRLATARRLVASGSSRAFGAAATTTTEPAVEALQQCVAEFPVPTVTTLDNGVTVASIFCSDAPTSHVTARFSGVGSRFDKVGGESALLASALGGVAGREFVSLPSLTALSSAPSADLASLKAALSTKIAGSSLESQVLDHLHSTAYQIAPKGNSLGNFLEGTEESVASIDASDLAAAAANVGGSDVVVVGTGSGVHEKLVEEAAKAYGGLKASSGKAVVEAKEASAFIGSDVRIRYDSHSTATFALGFEGASWTDPKAMTLSLMATILGSFEVSSGLGKNVTQAMCQEVALHDLASSISTFSLSYSDTGIFGIVATAPDNKLDDLLWYVMPNMVRLAHGISDEELARAKLALKAQLLSSYDGDAVLGANVARQMQSYGRFVPLAETLARVDALTMDDVKAAANDVINDQDHALAAIGGIHELPDYNWIRRHSYMLRY